MLGDEFSLDSCRLRTEDGKSLDKDLGPVIEGYTSALETLDNVVDKSDELEQKPRLEERYVAEIVRYPRY